MEILATIGKVLLVVLAVASVLDPLVSQRRNYGFVWQVWKRFRFGMFFQVLGVLIAVGTVVVVLWTYVPFLKWGWLNLFYDGVGNAGIKPITDASKSSNEFVRLLPVLFLVALMFVVPFMAQAEEKMFRKGHTEWREIVWQSVKFGLAHCIVGIPIAAGVALIISGLYFGYKYKCAFDRNVRKLGYDEAEKEALMTSTAAHSLYNLVVFTLLLVVALVAL
jgi:hypothetical protein